MNIFLWWRWMKHPYHIVDPSPWPLTIATSLLLCTSGFVSYIQNVERLLWIIGLLSLLFTCFYWWRDVVREGTLQGKHTGKVEVGIRIGILLFIVREVMFFFSFFWAFFHSSLSPSTDLGGIWPPTGLFSLNPFEVPLLNTTILLSSGVTITWTHMAVLNSSTKEAHIGFNATVLLGLFFTVLQAAEYLNGQFTISDSVFGRTFFLATGFHGLHVIIGTIFIFVMWVRHGFSHFSSVHHFGFEARAWYWHFVDVVWLFLYISLYWWGS